MAPPPRSAQSGAASGSADVATAAPAAPPGATASAPPASARPSAGGATTPAGRTISKRGPGRSAAATYAKAEREWSPKIGPEKLGLRRISRIDVGCRAGGDAFERGVAGEDAAKVGAVRAADGDARGRRARERERGGARGRPVGERDVDARARREAAAERAGGGRVPRDGDGGPGATRARPRREELDDRGLDGRKLGLERRERRRGGGAADRGRGGAVDERRGRAGRARDAARRGREAERGGHGERKLRGRGRVAVERDGQDRVAPRRVPDAPAARGL